MLSANLDDVFSSLFASDRVATAAAMPTLNPQDGMTVELEDRGQDFTEFDIKDGRIIDTRPCQGWMWNGRRVDNDSLAPGDSINLDGGSSEAMQLRYRVTSVRSLEVK